MLPYTFAEQIWTAYLFFFFFSTSESIYYSWRSLREKVHVQQLTSSSVNILGLILCLGALLYTWPEPFGKCVLDDDEKGSADV